MKTKYKILVIEDDKILGENICQILDAEGYIAEYAENGKIGLEKALNSHPDLIISDIMMPEMDGFQMLSEILKNEKISLIPFIFLTAKADEENLRKGMALGADDYIFKPFNIKDLLDSVEIRLRKKELEKIKLEQTKRQIFSKIHHDLRTPMMPILGYSDIIEQEENLEQVKLMVRVIKDSTKKLYNRIEKFLVYNDLDYKEYNKQQLEAQTVQIDSNIILRVIESINSNLKSIERTNFNVIPATLKMGSWCLQVLLREVIENALLYSPIEKPVLVNGEPKENGYELTITDFGRGMSKEEINSISEFNKFGENKIAEPGVGVGLSIVKKIAYIYQIQFRIKSTKNEKTICYFNIPIVR
ncbi:MAG: response regulator [Ignavibacterium sp.]|nr:response regulator [Ignavibacterium sp.]